MVKLVRFLRVMLVAFGMSGTLLVVFISCNILFDCLLVVGVKAFSFLSVKKMRKYFIKATFFMEWRQNEKWGEKP